MRTPYLILILLLIISSCHIKPDKNSQSDKDLILYAKRDAPIGGIWLKLINDYNCYFGFYGQDKKQFCGTYNIVSDTIKLFFKDTIPSSMTTTLLIKNSRLEYINKKGALKILINNIDSFIPPVPNYKGLTFLIEQSKQEYKRSDTIIIKYTFQNNSKTYKNLLIKNVMGFPIGMFGQLLDKNKNSILKYGNKQIYSSTIYSPKDLLNSYVRLKPGDTFSSQIKLMDMVELKKGIGVRELDKGTYYLTMTNYGLKSNELLIKIE